MSIMLYLWIKVTFEFQLQSSTLLIEQINCNQQILTFHTLLKKKDREKMGNESQFPLQSKISKKLWNEIQKELWNHSH